MLDGVVVVYVAITRRLVSAQLLFLRYLTLQKLRQALLPRLSHCKESWQEDARGFRTVVTGYGAVI
jgi:hypothetical protein